MTNEKRYNKRHITPEMIVAYLEKKTKKNREIIGKQLGVTGRTVDNWVGEVEEYLRQCPQYAEVAPRLAEMIPKSLDTYDKYLDGLGEKEGGDLIVATNILEKALGVLVARGKFETKSLDGIQDEQLLAALGEIIVNRPHSSDPDAEDASLDIPDGTEAQADLGAEPLHGSDPTPAE